MDVLVLAGTRQAKKLAERLVAEGVRVTSMLFGTVAPRNEPPGTVLRGGFGGVDGLVEHLARHPVDAVLDATHPFAQSLTVQAVRACRMASTPYLRYSRTSWAERPDSSLWQWVDDHDQACRAAGRHGAPALLTVGAQPLWHYHLLPTPVVARLREEPRSPLPADWRVVRDPGPFELAGELRLMQDVQVLVCRDSGGTASSPKLDAAARLGIPVVMVRRPSLPGPEVFHRDEVVAWLASGGPGFTFGQSLSPGG
ncbi:precorrin-6A/cobalt-precorrin-6A reductase [Luteococcus peritonei]|uniref:Precorrin-6A/cobalt-precorrin-6A reductase n=1 Tax=Luteococcus peritonei TaxID=88874 RepID=A0ABW4RR87_9ACTN